MVGKFGRHHDTVPMSWLWARLHKRSMRLIYFDGGFQAFADHLHGTRARRSAREVRLNTPVAAIRRHDDGACWSRCAGRRGRLRPRRRDHRAPPPGPPGAGAAARRTWPALGALRHLGAVVAVLALDRPLMDEVYWL